VKELAAPFVAERLGVIARPVPGDHREAWGVLNPGGCAASDGTYYLFPRQVAEGNYSRIGIARLESDRNDRPTGIKRLGIALEPQESYELSASGGGVEDPRVTYVAAIDTFVMAYTAYAPFTPRIALACSPDLVNWKRLGLLHFSTDGGVVDLNDAGNKDCVVLPEVVDDPTGEPSIALLHRPTTSVEICECERKVIYPPSGRESTESIWISYAPLREVLADLRNLTNVREHGPIMEPRFDWETVKIGAGAPPIPMLYGLFFVYHAVCERAGTRRYCAGIAILAPPRSAQRLVPVAGTRSRSVGDIRRDGHRCRRRLPDRAAPDERLDLRRYVLRRCGSRHRGRAPTSSAAASLRSRRNVPPRSVGEAHVSYHAMVRIAPLKECQLR
jgi:predicted GH43/DUF377 family glycosyl hydrolase